MQPRQNVMLRLPHSDSVSHSLTLQRIYSSNSCIDRYQILEYPTHSRNKYTLYITKPHSSLYTFASIHVRDAYMYIIYTPCIQTCNKYQQHKFLTHTLNPMSPQKPILKIKEVISCRQIHKTVQLNEVRTSGMKKDPFSAQHFCDY